MEPLGLETDGYRGTYKLIGGRPSLDLVNTISWPGTPRRHDWLNRPVNVATWLAAVDLAGDGVKIDLVRVHEIRRRIDDLIRPLAHGSAPAADSLDRFNRMLAEASGKRLIDPTTWDWVWRRPTSITEALAPVVFDAALVVVEEDHDRLRHCPSCDWIFFDGSRNGRRRWCDMADCGSRAKARRHYQRHQT